MAMRCEADWCLGVTGNLHTFTYFTPVFPETTTKVYAHGHISDYISENWNGPHVHVSGIFMTMLVGFLGYFKPQLGIHIFSMEISHRFRSVHSIWGTCLLRRLRLKENIYLNYRWKEVKDKQLHFSKVCILCSIGFRSIFALVFYDNCNANWEHIH